MTRRYSFECKIRKYIRFQFAFYVKKKKRSPSNLKYSFNYNAQRNETRKIDARTPLS